MYLHGCKKTQAHSELELSDISQGSVVTHLRCGGIFNYLITADSHLGKLETKV